MVSEVRWNLSSVGPPLFVLSVEMAAELAKD